MATNDKKKSNLRQIAFRVTKAEEIYLMRKCKERNERISTVMRRALWQYCGPANVHSHGQA